jgi:septal ring factor EnvC (AmiA/AmiB activator)
VRAPSESGTPIHSDGRLLVAARLGVLLVTGALCLLAVDLRSQPASDAQRISDRIAALEREAARLAGEARTLVGDLRKREIERDLKMAQLAQAQAASAEAERELKATTDRLSELELTRIRQLPDVKRQLVETYKRGRGANARVMFSATDLREFARATRAIGALSTLTERRIADHRRTLDAVRRERSDFERKAQELKARETEARQAKVAADAAVAAAADLIRQIDSRRDLTAQFIGELQVASSRLQQQVETLESGAARPSAVPLRPFQGALDWPVSGPIAGRFGQPSPRLGGAIRNGIEISAPEDAPVLAVHGGSVGYAGPFTGFGTLVILDHGANSYSLYGYLVSTSLQQGEVVEARAEVGRVGLAPAGPPTLYFEMRIDGRSVNPVQWLKPR